MADFADRIIVVTGAASGLGAATAALLARRGATVIGIATGVVVPPIITV